MADDQRTARIFGVLFIITFLTSIPAVFLFQPVLDDPAGYLAGDGQDNQIRLGAFLEFLLILANVGTAVVLYPIARRQNEILAIGYVAARIIECVFIAAGIIFVLGLVSLRQDSPDAADLAVSLAALKDWTFLFGPGLVVPFGNGLLLGYLMYTSGLVPRRMTWLGLIGGPLLLVGNLGVLFDLLGTNQRGGSSGRPRVPLGVAAWHLRGHLGIPAGRTHPLGARTVTSAIRAGCTHRLRTHRRSRHTWQRQPDPPRCWLSARRNPNRTRAQSRTPMNNTNTTKKAQTSRALLGANRKITRWGDGLTVVLSHRKMVLTVDVFHTT